jgi:hypothetical protein
MSEKYMSVVDITILLKKLYFPSYRVHMYSVITNKRLQKLREKGV